MKLSYTVYTLAVCGSLLSVAPLAQAADSPAGFIHTKPGELKWIDDPRRPGIKMALIEGNPQEPGPYIVRIKFPANYQGKAHWHPDTDRNTVISGVFYFGLGDVLDEAKAVAYPPGSVTVLPARINHFLYTKEETVIQVHGSGPQKSYPASEAPKQ
jgi:hypothetical protein